MSNQFFTDRITFVSCVVGFVVGCAMAWIIGYVAGTLGVN